MISQQLKIQQKDITKIKYIQEMWKMLRVYQDQEIMTSKSIAHKKVVQNIITEI